MVALAGSGFDIVICDRFSNSSIASINIFEKVVGRNTLMLECDILDAVRVIAEMVANQCQAVLHSPGSMAVVDSVDNPISYFAKNVNGAINLVQSLHAAEVRKLESSSSVPVYGEPEYLPYDEAHATKAIKLYDRAKLPTEEMLRDAAALDPTW